MGAVSECQIRRLQENLSAIRKTAGWTTDRLGQELGISRQSVSALENGRTTMTKMHYLAIRSVFESEAVESENRKLAYVLRALVDDPLDEAEFDGEGLRSKDETELLLMLS